MARRLSLSPVTIGATDFVEGCELAHAARYAGIGIRYDQLERFLSSGRTVADAKRVLEAAELTPTEAGFLAEWEFHGGIPLVSKRSRAGEDTDERRLLSRLHEFLERCAELGVRHVTAAATHDREGSLEEAASDFARLCGFAEPYGLEVGLEFFGNAKSFSTLREAARVVREAKVPNGGILLDTFFFHMGGSAPETIRELEGMGVSLNTVQLADAAAGDPSHLDILWDRRLPGEGVARLEAVVSGVEAAGYRGWYTLEVFHRPLPRAEALRLAKAARERTLDLLSCSRAA